MCSAINVLKYFRLVIPLKALVKIPGFLDSLHCGENSRIFRDAADQTLPETEFSEIYN